MAFEVAAIRADPAGEQTTVPDFLLTLDDSFVHKGGLFHADCLLLVYIEFAYKFRPKAEQREALLAHMPKWVSSEAFVIDARATGNPTNGQLRLMMQSLLVERFHLAIHFEERTVPVLALILEKPGVMGPKLRPHSGGPSCFEGDSPRNVDASNQAVPPPICRHSSPVWEDHGQLKLDSRDISVEFLANSLPALGHLGRPVIDETGLQGKYDFTLEWLPEINGDSPGMGGVNLFEALKQQLGLKLKPSKAPISTMIVDHIERPTEN